MASEKERLLDEETAAELVSACRTTIGDRLRSLTYFTETDFEQLYLRSDLESDADLTGFVEHESLGFDAHTAYQGSELGDYRFTIRVFDEGFLVRVTTKTDGIFLTTDGLTLRDFAEIATAMRSLLG